MYKQLRIERQRAMARRLELLDEDMIDHTDASETESNASSEDIYSGKVWKANEHAADMGELRCVLLCFGQSVRDVNFFITGQASITEVPPPTTTRKWLWV